MSVFPYRDPTFPLTADGVPDGDIIKRIRSTLATLSDKYRGVGKLSHTETFKNKVKDVPLLPMMEAIKNVCTEMFAELDGNLAKLETEFGKYKGKVDVKMTMVDGKKTNTILAKLWRTVTTTLAANILFIGKPRVGVIQHMTLSEYEAASRSDETVIWVCKHKLGDKQPATLVLDRDIIEMMDRYYVLRKKVANVTIENFFVTNTGSELKKVFDLINAECHKRQIRLPNKPDGAPGDILRVSGSMIRKQIETAGIGHRPEVTAGVASALQHSEDTAKRFYHVGSAENAKQIQRAIRVVEDSARMVEHIIDNIEHFMSVSDPFSETPSSESLIEMIAGQFPDAEMTHTAYDSIKVAHHKVLVGQRAKILAARAKSMGINSDIGIVQMKAIARMEKLNRFLECESTRSLLITAINNELNSNKNS